MAQKQIITLVAIAGAIVIVGGIFFLFVVKPDIVQAPTEDVIPSPSYTITPIPIDTVDNFMPPDTSRAILFSESVPEEARVALSEKAVALSAELKDDPSRADSWFNLAIVYHTANDYDGARAVWEFLTRAVPNDTTAYDNLGKLYHFSLRDYRLAESYFNQSIAIQPNLLTPYLELFNLYRYSYQTESGKAVEALEKAIAKFPDEIDLRVLLGDYHRDRAEYEKARASYTLALDKARAANDLERMSAIGDSLSKLPQ